MAKAMLNKLSLDDLKGELRRRQRELGKLQTQREKLAARLADLDRRIADLDGADAGAAGTRGRRGPRTTKAGLPRRRPQNKMSLADMLVQVFPKDKPMKVADAAAAAKKAGYKTTASNFGTIVNQALIKDPRFKQVSRGFYRLA